MTSTASAGGRAMINIPPEKLVHVAYAVQTWARCHDCEGLLASEMAKSVPPHLRPKRIRGPQAQSNRVSEAQARRDKIRSLHQIGYLVPDIAAALGISQQAVYVAIREGKRE